MDIKEYVYVSVTFFVASGFLYRRPETHVASLKGHVEVAIQLLVAGAMVS